MRNVRKLSHVLVTRVYRKLYLWYSANSESLVAISCNVEVFTHIIIACMLVLSPFRQQPGAILYPGQWSEKGCKTNFNSTMTVCKCNHLTHFAILLSARPLDLSREKRLALQITGYIGVSISLVAMAITVIVFLFLK